VNGHFLSKRGHLFGKGSFGFGAQPVYPELEGMVGRREQPFPFLRLQLAREGDGRELRRVQDFVRIRVADSADQARVGKGSLECAVFKRERFAKRVEITLEDLDSSWVDLAQALFASDDMQRSAVLCAGFGQHKRAVGKIEGRQTVAARQLCACRSPMQTACNHQVQHQPEIVFHSNRDALTDPPKFAHDAALDTFDWRLCGSQQERARQPHAIEGLRNDA